ncbi:MAG: SRPBCC domain-containing protein [Myxococcota bacterium]
MVSGLIPVSPQRVYAAWLDSSEHTSFTGGSKAEIEPKPGGRFKGQDGDIEGEIIELTPDQRILMSWRSRDFPAGAPDSRVEISLQPYAEADCQITIEHSEVPEAVAERFKREWIDRYVIPMRSYFQQLTASTARAEQAQRRVEEAERKLEAVLAAAPSEKTSKPSTKAAARGKTSAKKTTAPSPIKPDAKAARGTTDLASTEDEAQPAAPSATKA